MATVTLQKLNSFGGELQRAVVGPITGTLYTVNQLGMVTVSTLDSPTMIAKGGWLPVTGSQGGAATSGVAVVDFGAFPGSQFASTIVTAKDAADPNAVLMCEGVAIATVDHSADEHAVDEPIVSAVNNGDGTITISAIPNANVIPVDSMMPWGKWSVAYAFLP